MKTSITANGLLWFGAAISIAEMLSGTFFAPLGWQKGLLAIILGHILGGGLMYFSGLIGGKLRQNAMASAALSFGSKGAKLFAGLNVLQLIGWTAVMVLTGAQACQLFLPLPAGSWILLIGGLTILWVFVGLGNLTKLNTLAMVCLFVLGVYLSGLLTTKEIVPVTEQSISFGMALELAIAMPLSWLPLISDYTSVAKQPERATAVSVIVYNLASSWMYFIGMMGVLVTGKWEIAAMMKAAGIGVIALVIIILSTVTTTFLDVYSAGVSSQSLLKRGNAKIGGIFVCIAGMVIAFAVPMSAYESFLYLISSVFVPMITIQIVEFFLFRKKQTAKSWDIMNLLLWLLGFIAYQLVLKIETPLGSTVPVVAIVAVLAILSNLFRRGKNARSLS